MRAWPANFAGRHLARVPANHKRVLEKKYDTLEHDRASLRTLRRPHALALR
jgi:hypothetical protein